MKLKCRFWSLLTFKIALEAKICLLQEPFKKRFFAVLSMTNNTCKKNESGDQSRDVKRTRSILGSGGTKDPHLIVCAVIALSFCLSVSCSAQTFVSKLKLQGEGGGKKIKEM